MITIVKFLQLFMPAKIDKNPINLRDKSASSQNLL